MAESTSGSQNTEIVVVTNPEAVDLEKLAERVYQLLLRELVIENERSGRRN